MLCIYGPFLLGKEGRQRSLSSRVFDAALWLQSSEYGLRELNELNVASVQSCVESMPLMGQPLAGTRCNLRAT